VVESEPEQLSKESRAPIPTTLRITPRRLAAVKWLIGLILTVGACGGANANSQSSDPGVAEVIEVVDGDTIILSLSGSTTTVRLLGIDAPESVHPQLPVQCFGPEASTALGELLPGGTQVRVERDVNFRDHFGRALLYVYRTDNNLFVNEWLVESGLADTANYEPNSTHRVTLQRAKTRAKQNKVGLWFHCDGPNQPLDPP